MTIFPNLFANLQNGKSIGRFWPSIVRHLRRWTTGSDFGPRGATDEEIVDWSSACLSEYENCPAAAAGGCRRTRNDQLMAVVAKRVAVPVRGRPALLFLPIDQTPRQVAVVADKRKAVFYPAVKFSNWLAGLGHVAGRLQGPRQNSGSTFCPFLPVDPSRRWVTS